MDDLRNEQPVWEPSAERKQASNMAKLMTAAADCSGRSLTTYADLHAWSVEEPAAFWSLLWNEAEICGARGDGPVLADSEMPLGAEWFPDARLNFAENLLRTGGSAEALVFVSETGTRETLTWDELSAAVANVANALKRWGVGPGDRVAAYVANRPETVVAMLATASVGGIFSSCSQDFGSVGVLDRFGQIRPKVLFATDGYFYAGKSLDCRNKVAALADALPSLKAIVLIGYREAAAELPGRLPWYRYQELATGTATLQTEALPFSHPLYILFSSGTTGTPKCIVHGAGGTLLQHKKELLYHTDLKGGQRICFFTTCGWMMWNWLVSSLSVGATVVLYDGSPFQPDSGALWRLAERESLDVLGVSAKYLSAVEKDGLEPRTVGEFETLKTVLSTGSPLAPSSYDFVYSSVKKDVLLASISGGTDIISCFALGNPVAPVFRGEIQCLGLGMDVDIFADDGTSLREEKGELVCKQPFPSMPLGFYGDADGSRYQEAYFERFPGVWHHGDYAEITRHGGLIIYGRSDTVLNPGGVRIGTAEIYRVVETLDAISEAVVVGQRTEDDVRIVLFVCLQPGVELTPSLEAEIRSAIREQASPRHVPAVIAAVSEIPRTRSGKIVEVAIRKVIHGEPVTNTEALQNPDALDQFENHPALHS